MLLDVILDYSVYYQSSIIWYSKYAFFQLPATYREIIINEHVVILWVGLSTLICI